MLDTPYIFLTLYLLYKLQKMGTFSYFIGSKMVKNWFKYFHVDFEG